MAIKEPVQPAVGLAAISQLLDSADTLARDLGYPDASLQAAYHRQILMLLAQAYVQVFGTSIENPDWVPHTGPLFPWGAPNHDTIYGFAPIDPQGLYRVSGTQGTETLASLMFRKGGANTGQVHGATLGEIDVCALQAGVDRCFSLLISREKPTDCQGLWFPLPAESTGLVARHVTQEPNQSDGVWSLERLDRPAASVRLNDELIATRMGLMTQFVGRLNEFLLRLVMKLRADGYTNSFLADRFQGNGGIAAQLYFQSLFEFDADEVLILESQLPRSVNYWSVQLVDPFYSAIDFIFHSSAYNGRQARIDSDGNVRFVIAAQDPGVPNWLDSAGWRRGGMFWRWHEADSFPVPTVKRVNASTLREHLPGDVPQVAAAQRALERAARISQYQSRRRW